MLNNKPRVFFIGLCLITTALMIFAAIQTVYLFNKYQQSQQNSKQWAEQQTQFLATDLSTNIQKISAIADALAEALSSAECSPCNIEDTLRAAYLQHTGFTALGVAFDVESSATTFRLYAPFIRQNAKGANIERLDSYYDYTVSSNQSQDVLSNPEAWYQIAKNQERQWLKPFYDSALEQYVIRFTSPVYSAKNKIGLVFVDINFEWLHDQIEKYDIKDNNYLSLLTAQGNQLYHSFSGITQTTEHLTQSITINTLTNSTSNLLTGEPAWQHSVTIPATQWQLRSVISKTTISELFDSSETINTKTEKDSLHKLTQHDRVDWVILLVVIGILLYSCIRLRRKRTSKQQLWIDTGVYTLIFFAGVISIWVLEYGTINASKKQSIILANKAIIEKFERENALRALNFYDEAPIYVPIGLFIQSIEFLSASNVNITGYVWHRYQEGQKSDYEIGTVFPEAIATNISLAYEQEKNGETLKGWYFETTLRENFNPDLFPLDRQSVWIRLWHENIGDNIILVPDLKAYDSLNTRSLPGVEKDFVLSGWSLFRSYFEIREHNFNTRLGITNKSPNGVAPELYFNIEIIRNFINPFLAHLFPLFVVILMLYAIVITMSTDEDKKDYLGFNAAGVVASCSALFFVALISHVQLRNELAANSVVYLEYFYLITYVIILLITVNAVLLSLKVKFIFIQFHDNLLPKLLYWPAISGALFICTAWAFRH
jgi:hypothetical protein